MVGIVKRALGRVLPPERYEGLRAWYWKAKKKLRHPLKAIRSRVKSVRGRADRYFTLAIRYPRLYKRHSRNAIEDKIIFIEVTAPRITNNFQTLADLLTNGYTYDIHFHFLKKATASPREYKRRCLDLIRDMATAKYIFINDACNAFGRIRFRPGTQFVQLWHACGAFKKFGFSTAELIFGENRRTMTKYPFYQHCTMVTVSSPEVAPIYAEAMGIGRERVLPLGVSRTDVFFDPSFIRRAKEKFEWFMPSSKGKKAILFAPTFRGRVAKAATSAAFSIPLFFEALSDDFVLVIMHHPFVKKAPAIPEKYREFAVDFTDVMSIDELLCVADICISDYSSLVFEYSLFEKPMLFFAYDLETYFDWRGFYFEYEELTPGPVFKTNREMIDYIRHVDERFDKSRVVAFRDKFMASCDGHSTERILNRVFGDDLQRHAKPEAEPIEEAALPCGDWDAAARDLALARLYELFPQLQGKKIVGYFVTPRRAAGYPKCRPVADWQYLYEYLDDRYAVLYYGPGLNKRLKAPSYYHDKVIECSKCLTEMELFLCSDRIVSDFNDHIARMHRFDKPFYLFIPDYRWYCSSIDDYTETTGYLMDCGCFYETTPDLVAAVNSHDDHRVDQAIWLRSYQAICRHLK